MGNDEIETKSRDMFNDILTIDAHFENVGYKGDTVILGINELAEFIRFYQSAAPQWQPIESAPKDGTRVLLLMVGGKQCVARTEHNPFRGSQWVIYGELGKPGCWVLASDDDTQPTHWMPLPAAPK